MEEKKFTHIGDSGNPAMVDVGQKNPTRRTARARSIVIVGKEILAKLSGDEIMVPKGPVFQTAIIAGIMAAKKTGELIPLCHPIGLDHVSVEISVNDQEEIVVDCTASVYAKTGVEMEALTGASVAALTVYDMCKALSHDIIIRETLLMEKTGGKKDFFRTNP
ncbi:MAG: cyclic pyranopterin monophosphate synthase MoaC [Bacteroidia bacterium]